MMALMLAVAAAGCTAVEGDRILAGDMARLWPEFANVPASTPLGYAPVPGTRRVFAAAELARTAARFGVTSAAPEGMCFERRTVALTRERALEAMRAALNIPEARIEIVELSRYPVPEGDVVFPRAALRSPGAAAPPGTPVLWRGEVRYGSGRRFAIWAKVMVAVPGVRLRAAAALRAGEPVRREQLRVERCEAFPSSRREPGSTNELAGLRPRRTIAAGTVIRLEQFETPHDVERGEPVKVEVASGAARLALTGRAESPGSAGQTIQIRNPASGRTFPARVSGKGTAVVETGGERQ
jgi:flagella basal body P-ring formation protein FlgA